MFGGSDKSSKMNMAIDIIVQPTDDDSGGLITLGLKPKPKPDFTQG